LISRLGRKRRERRAQTQPDHPFAIEACEYLTDGAFALLRVSGAGDVAPVSLVTQGDGPQAFDPLPQPDAGPSNGFWHIAFALPTEVIEPGARVWLHDGGLYLADLLIPGPPEPPKPAEPAEPAITPEAEDAAERLAAARERIAADKAAASARPAETTDVGDDARARKLVEAWSEAATLREKLNDREQELAEALQELLEARKDVQPLRDRVEQLTADVDALREELELAHKHGREARMRATEKSAELDAVRAELTAAQERVGDEQELAGLPAEVERLEHELATARAETAASEEKRTKLEESNKSRRNGIARRSEDRAARKQVAELEAELAKREQRIQQLEKDAESFAERREEAVSDSLRERIAELEQDVRQRASTNDDLRALLESERQIVATGRREVEDLKQQLATAAPEQAAEQPRPAPKPVVAARASANGGQSPPWSALDEELLARIEKAKALTR
jgi:outer membrane murein-binding lipoprotein Lpp